MRRKPAGQRPLVASAGNGARSWADRPPRKRNNGSASAAYNRFLADHPVAAVVVSPAGMAVASNQAWTELVGLDATATAGHGWLDAIHPDNRDQALEAVTQAASLPGAVNETWRLLDTDDQRGRIAQARASRGAAGNVLVALWERLPDDRNGRAAGRATHDPVTGLLNRDALGDRARQSLERLRAESAPLALLLVDIDDFDAVNERFGRHAGDRVLVAASAALAAAVRPHDWIARIDGDTFGVLCEATSEDEVAMIARQLRKAVSRTIDFGDIALDLTATVVASYTRDASDCFDILLDRADRALYFSKRTRRAAAPIATIDATATQPTSAVRVLIVDDTNLVAEALMTSLQQHGFGHVALARTVSANGVIAAARDFGPDVALVDSELSGSATSLSLIRTLNEMGIVVVMLTATDEPERSARCLEAGAVGIFDKSRALEDLMVLLTDAAMGRTVLQPASRDALLAVVRSQREETERRLAPFRSLTSREQAVLAALMDGKTAEVIAKEHNVSVATIRTQIRAVLQKLGVKSQLAAVALAIRAEWQYAG